MKTLAKHLALAVAALGLAGAAVAPALAGEPGPKQMAVNTHDLDLTTPGGQKQLSQRIERAARSVCQIERGATGSRMPSQDARDCLAKARAEARQKVAAATEAQQRGG